MAPPLKVHSNCGTDDALVDNLAEVLGPAEAWVCHNESEAALGEHSEVANKPVTGEKLLNVHNDIRSTSSLDVQNNTEVGICSYPSQCIPTAKRTSLTYAYS